MQIDNILYSPSFENIKYCIKSRKIKYYVRQKKKFLLALYTNMQKKRNLDFEQKGVALFLYGATK